MTVDEGDANMTPTPERGPGDELIDVPRAARMLGISVTKAYEFLQMSGARLRRGSAKIRGRLLQTAYPRMEIHPARLEKVFEQQQGNDQQKGSR